MLPSLPTPSLLSLPTPSLPSLPGVPALPALPALPQVEINPIANIMPNAVRATTRRHRI